MSDHDEIDQGAMFDLLVSKGLTDQEIFESYANDEDMGEMLVALARVRGRRLEETLATVFERLEALAKGEEDKADELVGMLQALAPHQRVDRDLDSFAGLARKAAMRQRAMSAYKWAAHDIKCSLNLPTTDAEDSEACRNHPTERDR